MPTLTKIKEQGWLREHQLQHVEDSLTKLVGGGLDGGILMAINFEDWDLIHPDALTQQTVNIIAEKSDVLRIKEKLQTEGSKGPRPQDQRQ